jgi:predicted nucleotidyltransferase
MTLRDLVRDVVALLEESSTDYMIVGAMAYFLYGRPRATKDADFVVATNAATLEQILDRLPVGCRLDPQARMELFTGTMRWVVDVDGTPLKLELFLLSDDAHHREEFARRKRQRLPHVGLEASVATAEDLIVQKLRWARDKDIADVRDIVGVQGDALDFPYIERWCRTHGTLARFEEIRRSIPMGL